MLIESLKCIMSRIGLVAVAIGTLAIINSNFAASMLQAQTSTQSGPNQRVKGKVPENWTRLPGRFAGRKPTSG